MPPAAPLQLRAALAGLTFTVISFPARDLAALPPSPLCWMWERLALAAVRDLGARYGVLLGDDTQVTPAGAWPGLVLQRFRQEPHVRQDGMRQDG